MIVQVKLFAGAKEIVGAELLDVPLDESACFGDLRAAMVDRFPQLDGLLRHALFAMDAQYATDKTKIRPGSEVACIPPVSGG